MNHPLRSILNRLSLLSSALVMLTPSVLPAFTQPTLSISSGSQTGTVYAVSNGISKIFNRKAGEYGYRLAAVPSEGSVADVNNVLAGQAAFGIAQSAVLQDAAQGNGPWQGKGSNNLRAVLSLHAESLSIVAAAGSGIRQLSDLKGKRVNVGAPGSADHQYAAEALLELAGLQPSEFTLTAHPASLAPECLHRDQIDAYIYLVGHPNLSVLEASSGPRKVLLVPLGMPLIAQIGKMKPLLVPAQIPTDFYPGLQDNGTISTVSLRDVLFTRADMDDETVYRLVKEVLTNFDLFRRQHPALGGLTRNEAAQVVVIPTHPGAARYFREAGVNP